MTREARRQREIAHWQRERRWLYITAALALHRGHQRHKPEYRDRNRMGLI